MGRDFYQAYAVARDTIEEAEDLLEKNLKEIIFEGPESTLTQTHHSQLAIYVISMAQYNVVQELFPHLTPSFCSGLSLGEYTAITAANKMSYKDCLKLVERRGQFMSDACESTKGTMAVVLGLDGDTVESFAKGIENLWVANLNCPGQVVISGTQAGIDRGAEAAKQAGAKRVLPLQVHGAFHSGLMQQAEERLAPYIHEASIVSSETRLAMNVPGDLVEDISQIRQNLISQVTHSVRWQQGIESLCKEGVDLFIEVGCGKTLAGMNKRMGVSVPTISIEKVEDLKQLETVRI